MVIEGEVDMAKHDHNNWCMISAVFERGKVSQGRSEIVMKLVQVNSMPEPTAGLRLPQKTIRWAHSFLMDFLL